MSEKSKQERGKQCIVGGFVEHNKRGVEDVEDVITERKKEGSTTKKGGLEELSETWKVEMEKAMFDSFYHSVNLKFVQKERHSYRQKFEEYF